MSIDFQKIFLETKENPKNDNPWEGTYIAEYYKLTPKKRGTRAEKIIEKILTQLGYDVQPPTENNGGYDRIVNGIKTEIKFGLAANRNEQWRTVFNHISMQKDWEQIIFGCINGDLSVRIVCFKRNNLPQYLLSCQQGGKKIQNDDFMISGKKSVELLFDENAEVIWIS